MAWELDPPVEVRPELEHMGEMELRSLMREVREWEANPDFDDMSIARGIAERGYSEDFAWWPLKEMRMEGLD